MVTFGKDDGGPQTRSLRRERLSNVQVRMMNALKRHRFKAEM